MIFDTLANIDNYVFTPAIRAVLNYAKQLPLDKFPAERVVLDGDNLFINPQQYVTKDPADAFSEAHREYVDVFVMLDGEETVYVKNTDRLSRITKDYDPAIDALFAEKVGDMTAVRMQAGTFLILYPQDAHAPCCHADGPAPVKKLVGKVKIH